MADGGGSMTTGNPSCEWVRDWLPLLAGDGELVSGEGGDLGAEDRRLVERHLDACASCRQHRTSLEGALSILGAIAVEPPIPSLAGSVWPDLETRIQRHHDRERSAWGVILRRTCPEGVRNSADRLHRGWGEFREQLPFRIVWAHDSLLEFLEARLVVPRAVRAFGRGPDFEPLIPRLALGIGLGLLTIAIVLPAIHHRRSQAEATIALNATPIPAAAIAPTGEQDDLRGADPVTAQAEALPAESLAQADPPPLGELPVVAQGQGAAARPSAAAATVPMAHGYDLEYGVPMPPETRGGRSAY